MQASIKVANEPPTDVKSLFRSAYALFGQDTLDASTRPVAHRPMLFALSFFHAIALGRRKFGKQGLSRPYAWNSGDLLVCGMILHNYLEANEDTPWVDVRYLFGEVMYGGHITDDLDRRLCASYLSVYMTEALLDGFQLYPKFEVPSPSLSYKQLIEHIDENLINECSMSCL